MEKIVNYLNGKKTYIGILAGAIYSILVSAGVVENSEMVWTLILTWTGVSFRAALNK